MTTFTMRRTTLLTVAATALACAVLSGCTEDPKPAAVPAAPAAPPASSAPAPAAVAGAFAPEDALVEAEKTPYAASMTITTEAAGKPVFTMTGRFNVNTAFTGRSELRSADDAPGSQAVWMETVTTADGNYIRNRPGTGGWVKAPRTVDNSQANYAGYAKLLLATGPGARKGMEDQGGIPAYHLSGRLDLDQVAAVDPRTHRSMKAKGVTGFDCDQWIDSQGRTLRFEQRMVIRGFEGANKAVFGDFGPVETFAVPTD